MTNSPLSIHRQELGLDVSGHLIGQAERERLTTVTRTDDVRCEIKATSITSKAFGGEDDRDEMTWTGLKGRGAKLLKWNSAGLGRIASSIHAQPLAG